jgi:arylsulfatase A-like enzyme
VLSIQGCTASDTSPPNIIVYVVDTLRSDAVGAYGHPESATPHVDAFASEGVVFENAFANASWTRPSMASLLTGLLPWSHGAEGRDDLLPEDVPTLATYLAERGYSSALVTSNPNVGSVFGFQRGFDEVSELYARTQPGPVRGKELVARSDEVTAEAIRWLQGAKAPFFLVVLTIDPHAPYTPPRHFDPAKLRAGTRVNGLFSTLRRDDLSDLEKARIRELYQAEVAFNDDSFGKLLKALAAKGEDRNSIVVLTSDHGEEFWEYGRRGHGLSLSEQVLRVPLVVRHPASRRLIAGGRTERPITLADLVPTLLDLAGLPIPDDLDGASFFATGDGSSGPQLAGLRLDDRRLLAARDGRWKLVWDLADDTLELHDLTLPSAEAGPIEIEGNAEAAKALETLRRSLTVSIQAGAQRAIDPERAGALPSEVEESLRALGYLD